MASRSADPPPVRGRVDSRGRLIAADPELETLQCEAGSSLGSLLAMPQLAAIARLARQLRMPVARGALVAGATHNIDMWVRAAPEGEDVTLTIERWHPMAPVGPRLASSGGEAASLSQAARWSVDEDLQITCMSDEAAELMGVAAAEGPGQLLTRVVKLCEDSEGAIPMLQALAYRSSFSGQLARRRSDGTPLLLSGEIVLGARGSFAGFEGIVALGEAAGPDGLPAAAPAFDELLRSPLRHIIDSAERIAGRADGPLSDEYAAYAADISAAANHLLSVVRSMSDDSAAGGAPIDLVELVYEAVGLMEAAASERGIVIALDPLPSLAAHGKARGVIQILVNLISNAVRHSPLRATVTVSFELSDGQAIVHVADDGPGIDLADQQRIFERFETGTGEGQGSGLGLAIARRLARSMDGDIQLESSPGRGSRFSLVLPAA